MEINDDVAQNLRKRQMKKYLESKFSKQNALYIKQALNKPVNSVEDVENLIMDCLKSHELTTAINIANHHQQFTLAHLLTAFEMGNSDVTLKNLDPSAFESFPRVIKYISGDLSELYEQKSKSQYQKLQISILNMFACELWYQQDQRLSLASIFDLFIQKLNGQIYDADKQNKIISLEILLIALYSQHQNSEKSSTQLKKINLFEHINSLCYSQSKLDKRLSWFIIEFLNTIYFNDDLIFKNKRAILMRGFLQQLSILKKWKYEIVVLVLMKGILKRSQFTTTVRNIFLTKCIPIGNKELKIPNLNQMNNLSYSYNQAVAPCQYANSQNSLDASQNQHILANINTIPESQSIENILNLFYSQYSHESQGLYYYNYHQYQKALQHLTKQSNLKHLDICNKIITYYEGPRIYLFGDTVERQEIENYLSLISKKSNHLSKYKYQSRLIHEIFKLLKGEQKEFYKQEYINDIFNLKDLLIKAQKVLCYVSNPDYYEVIEENKENQLKNKQLRNKIDKSVTRIDNGGILFEEFIQFIFQQLAERVPDIRRFCKHVQTTSDVQQLLEIVSENKTPKNEQIKDLILSTLPIRQ